MSPGAARRACCCCCCCCWSASLSSDCAGPLRISVISAGSDSRKISAIRRLTLVTAALPPGTDPPSTAHLLYDRPRLSARRATVSPRQLLVKPAERSSRVRRDRRLQPDQYGTSSWCAAPGSPDTWL